MADNKQLKKSTKSSKQSSLNNSKLKFQKIQSSTKQQQQGQEPQETLDKPEVKQSQFSNKDLENQEQISKNENDKLNKNNLNSQNMSKQNFQSSTQQKNKLEVQQEEQQIGQSQQQEEEQHDQTNKDEEVKYNKKTEEQEGEELQHEVEEKQNENNEYENQEDKDKFNEQEESNNNKKQEEVDEEQQQQKVTKPNPAFQLLTKCRIEEHNEPIVGICLKDNCEKKSRLVCFACAISHHSDHAQYIVRLQDLKEGYQPVFIRNWPTDELSNNILRFLKCNETVYVNENIDDIYAKFENSFEQYLTRSKDKLLEDMQMKLQPNEAKLKDLRTKFEDTYSLKYLRTLITNFNSSKRQDNDVKNLEKQIQQFLTGKQTELAKKELDQLYLEKKKIIKDTFKDDLLEHNFNKIIKNVDEIPVALVPPENQLSFNK